MNNKKKEAIYNNDWIIIIYNSDFSAPAKNNKIKYHLKFFSDNDKNLLIKDICCKIRGTMVLSNSGLELLMIFSNSYKKLISIIIRNKT